MVNLNISGLKMKRESKSFVDSLHAVLTVAQLFDGPKYRLSGLSAMAFKFSVHERLLPLSVTAYGQWSDEHKPAIENLGLYTANFSGRTRHPTFRYYQQEAVERLKESLTEGTGAIYWIPEFGVIHGYDDADRVFFVQNGWSEESQVVLYDNLGLNATPFWYIQLFGGKVDVPREVMLLESLRLAVHDWDTPYKTLPNRDIASGKLAYDYLIRALELGDYDEGGAAYIVQSYLYSRREIRQYLYDEYATLEGLEEAYSAYEELDDAVLSEIDASCFCKEDAPWTINRDRRALLIDRLEAAKRLESRAMDVLRHVASRYPDPKRAVIPRWGVHIPK